MRLKDMSTMGVLLLLFCMCACSKVTENVSLTDTENNAEIPDSETEKDSVDSSNLNETESHRDTESYDEDFGDCFDGSLAFELDLPPVRVDPSWSPTGPYWKMKTLPVERLTVIENGPIHDERDVLILLETTLPNDCWRLNSVFSGYHLDPIPRLVSVALRAWHLEQSECLGTPRKARRVFELELGAYTVPWKTGCWTVVDFIGGERLSFDVARCEDVAAHCGCGEDMPAGQILEGEPCELDCQCRSMYMVCQSVSESLKKCVYPCNVDGDCWAGECVESLSGVRICRRHTSSVCTGDDDCEPHQRCMTPFDAVNYCATDIDLSMSIRHECTRNEDCETSGLVCTLADGWEGDGQGICNFPCESNRTVCPGMHSCLPGIGGKGVCEWVGE